MHEKLTALQQNSTNKTPKLCTLHAVSRNPTACWSSGSVFVWSFHVMGSTVYTVHFRCVKICRNLTHANCLITRNFQSCVNRSKYIFWSTMSRFFFSQCHGYMLYFLPKCPNLSIPDKISRSRKNFVFFQVRQASLELSPSVINFLLTNYSKASSSLWKKHVDIAYVHILLVLRS